MSAYIALGGLLLSIAVGFIAHHLGAQSAELACQQQRDQSTATKATDANDVLQQQATESPIPRTVYVQAIELLPGPAVVLDRLAGLCGPIASAGDEDRLPVPSDGADIHGGTASDAGDRRTQLAADIESCAVIKAQLVGLQGDVCAKSAPAVRASPRCVELLGPL